MLLTHAERLVLLALAIFRLTFTIVLDDGPFDMLVNVRTALGVYDLQENNQPKRGIASFLSCAYCVSRFLSLIAIPLYIWPSMGGDALILWWGLSGAAALLIRWRPWTSY